MKKFALLAFCAIGVAHADIIPRLGTLGLGSGGVSCGVNGGGVWGCNYSYTASLHGDATLTADQSDHEEYFTIYDFNGYINGSAVAPGPGLWTITAQNVGITPDFISLGTEDDAAIMNITFKYVGGTNVPGGSDLGTFTLRSRFGPDVTGSHFTSQATHAIRTPGGDSWVRNVGNVDVPSPFLTPDDQSAVPEPMTMGLIGSGLAGLGLFRRFRQTN